MRKPKSDRTIVLALLKKHNKNYFYVKKSLKRLGWTKNRIIAATDFLFK